MKLTKDQIDAVAEWMTTQKWGIFGMKDLMYEIRHKFVEDFSPKELPLSGTLPASESNTVGFSKITDLSNTKIWIGSNPELSEKIQEKATMLGWHLDWSNRKKQTGKNMYGFIFYPDKSISFLNTYDEKESREFYASQTRYTEIFPEQILEDKSSFFTSNDKDDNVIPKHLVNEFFDKSTFPQIMNAIQSGYVQLSDFIKWGHKENDVEKPKTYILLKDLPYIKAGSRFIYRKGFDDYAYINDIGNVFISYSKDFVDNSPEWFALEEEKEPSLLYTRKDMEHCFSSARAQSIAFGSPAGYTYGSFEDYLNRPK